MEETELKQEVEKLNARLKKAVEVFNEQKATIKRLTEERDSAIAKTKQAEEQDEQFFNQVNEINSLTEEVKTLNERIEKATEAYKELNAKCTRVNNELTDTEIALHDKENEVKTLKERLQSIIKICTEE